MSPADDASPAPPRVAVQEPSPLGTRGSHEVHIVEERWATLRHVVEAVAIVCAGIWAFYTFIYQEDIKPASEPAALNASITVTGLRHDRVRDIMELSVLLRNTGKTEIDIAADAYNVWGERYGARPVARKREEPDRYEYDAGLPIVSRKLLAALAELRDAAVGGRRGTHIVLEPGELETIGAVFAVPRGAYDIINAQVIAVPIKTSATEKVPVTVVRSPVGGYGLKPGPGAEEDDNHSYFALPP